MNKRPRRRAFTCWECSKVGPIINSRDGRYLAYECSNSDCSNVSCMSCTRRCWQALEEDMLCYHRISCKCTWPNKTNGVCGRYLCSSCQSKGPCDGYHGTKPPPPPPPDLQKKRYFIRRRFCAGHLDAQHPPADWLRLFETRTDAEEWAQQAASSWQVGGPSFTRAPWRWQRWRWRWR